MITLTRSVIALVCVSAWVVCFVCRVRGPCVLCTRGADTAVVSMCVLVLEF